jgi:nickel/cobalt transporter (NicO) family protein
MSELYALLLRTLTTWQYELNKLISHMLKTIDSGEVFGASMTILGIALVYGIIHALGPGHGKALVGLYFLKEGGSYQKALKMGYLIALVHALSALGLTLGIYYLIDAMFSKTFQTFSMHAMSVSALLIIAVGGYLVYEAWRERHGCESLQTSHKKSAVAVAVSAGIVPCPGVMTITLFALHMGHVVLGVASALVMSVGMGLTISLAGIGSVAIKHKSDGLLGKYGHWLQIASALLVMGLGVVLLAASLK